MQAEIPPKTHKSELRTTFEGGVPADGYNSVSFGARAMTFGTEVGKNIVYNIYSVFLKRVKNKHFFAKKPKKQKKN
jgi:hypothetical protein